MMHTRRLLVDAARQVFTKRGFGNATIEDISNFAGVSRGTFYRHFTSKESVIQELLAPAFRETQAHYELFQNISDLTPENINRWMTPLFHIWARYHRELSAIFIEENSIVRAEFLERVNDFVETIVGSRTLKGRFGDDEIRRRVHLLLMQQHSAIAENIGSGLGGHVALLETLTDIWISTLSTSQHSNSKTCDRSSAITTLKEQYYELA
jgi:AcrR family transcriptional regulator